MELNTFSDLTSIIESIATIVAIVVGGFWTYFLFIKHRQRFPRANVEHAFEQVRLSGGNTLLHVAAIISNDGNVLVSLESVRTRLQQILPVPDHILSEIEAGDDPVPQDKHEVPWPVLGAPRERKFSIGEAEVEPGEREVLDSEFIIGDCVETVVVYTYVKNRSKREREIGWSKTTILKLSSLSEEVKRMNAPEPVLQKETAAAEQTPPKEPPKAPSQPPKPQPQMPPKKDPPPPPKPTPD